MNEALEVSMQIAIQDLANRVKRLEETTSIAYRDGGTIAMPCPYCVAEDENLYVESFPHPNTRFPSKFAVRCKVCFAQGPQVTYGNDAISAWNKFVSHHDKVQT